MSNNTMEATNKSSQANDYAVAKALSGLVYRILVLVYIGTGTELYKEREIVEINRTYRLITHELEKLYARNNEVAEIEPAPIWMRFDVLKNSTEDIANYFNATDDHGTNHTVRVEKLCIIAGVDEP